MRTRLRILGAVVVTSVAAAAVPILTSSDADAARFTIDNLVVYRVGLGSAAHQRRRPGLPRRVHAGRAAPVQSIALPTTPSDGNAALTASGLSRSEGLISRSADGKYLAVTGYDAARRRHRPCRCLAHRVRARHRRPGRRHRRRQRHRGHQHLARPPAGAPKIIRSARAPTATGSGPPAATAASSPPPWAPARAPRWPAPPPRTSTRSPPRAASCSPAASSPTGSRRSAPGFPATAARRSTDVPGLPSQPARLRLRVLRPDRRRLGRHRPRHALPRQRVQRGRHPRQVPLQRHHLDARRSPRTSRASAAWSPASTAAT